MLRKERKGSSGDYRGVLVRVLREGNPPLEMVECKAVTILTHTVLGEGLFKGKAG